MTRSACIAAFLFALALPASTQAQPAAVADTRTASTAAEAPVDPRVLLEQAQQYVNVASQAFAGKDFGKALANLKKAESLVARTNDPSLPRIRFNIARCYEELQQWDEAMEAYQRYNQLPDDSHRKQRAWESMRQLQSRLYATLSVACAPAGSLIEIAGITEGPVGCPWQSSQVRPGAYAVKISHPGYESAIETVDLMAGKSSTVEVSLTPLEPIPGLAVGPSKPTNYWPWLTMGAGLVVVASGGFFTRAAVDNRDEAQDLPPTPERAELVDNFEFNRSVSYAMYGTGAAIVVGGVVWWVLDRYYLDDDDQDDPTAIRVEASANGFSVQF